MMDKNKDYNFYLIQNWCRQWHAKLTWSWPESVNWAIFWHLRLLTEQRKHKIKSMFIFRYFLFLAKLLKVLCESLAMECQVPRAEVWGKRLKERLWSVLFTGSPGESKTWSTSSGQSANAYIRMWTCTPGWCDSSSPVGFTISYRTPRNRCTTA